MDKFSKAKESRKEALSDYSIHELTNELNDRQKSNQFPVFALPSTIVKYFEKHDYIDSAILASAFVSALFTAVGSSHCASIKIKGESRKLPMISWITSVGLSGNGKGAAQQIAMSVLNEIDNSLKYDGQEDNKKRLIIKDIQIPTMINTFQYTPKGILLNTDELSSFLAQLSSSKNLGDEGRMLQLFDGNSYSKVTGAKTTDLRFTNINIYGSIQDNNIDPLFAKGRATNGFLARFNFFIPTEFKILQTEVDEDQFEENKEVNVAKSNYENLIKNLYFQNPVNDTIYHNRKEIKFSNSSASYFNAYQKKIIAYAMDESDSPKIEAIYLPCAQRIKDWVLKYASILALIEHTETPETTLGKSADFFVKDYHIEQASYLGDYFIRSSIFLHKLHSENSSMNEEGFFLLHLCKLYPDINYTKMTEAYNVFAKKANLKQITRPTFSSKLRKIATENSAFFSSYLKNLR